MKYHNQTCLNNPFSVDSPTIMQINEYTENVMKNNVVCGLPECRRCQVNSEHFKRHELRLRYFWAVVDQIVHKIQSMLIRWKCPGCNKITTEYPEFALPYKRYVLPVIVTYTKHYTGIDSATYRGLIDQTPLIHDDDRKMLEPSTVHRWITTLGNYTNINRRVQELILQEKPASSVCRDVALLSVSHQKYRSHERRSLLLNCQAFHFLKGVFQQIFSVSIFPRLATACAYS